MRHVLEVTAAYFGTTVDALRSHSRTQPLSRGELAEYDRRLFDLIRQPLPLDDASGGVRPRTSTLSPAARRVWIDFSHWAEVRLGQGREFETMKGAANKLAENAGRLAGVLSIVGNSDAGEIDAAMLENGVMLMRHYAAEALQLCQWSAADPELQLAQWALVWIRERRGVFSLPDVYQRGPNPISNKETATGSSASWLTTVTSGR